MPCNTKYCNFIHYINIQFNVRTCFKVGVSSRILLQSINMLYYK